jgi:hypothetical protein
MFLAPRNNQSLVDQARATIFNESQLRTSLPVEQWTAYLKPRHISLFPHFLLAVHSAWFVLLDQGILTEWSGKHHGQ